MENRITRISPKRKQELRELIDLIRQESYDLGYEDGKFVQSVDNVDGINDKWLAERKPKTPNQHRAELIERAKAFVKVKSECVKDSTLVAGGWERKVIENPNYKDFRMEVVFVINESKRTVVALCKFSNGEVKTKGIAKCAPGEVFNEHIGQAISLARALQIDIPVEFLETVQPSEVVVGHKVRGKYAKKTYEVPAFHSREHLGGMFGRSIAIEGINSRAWVGEKQVKIIDDTNAQYEVGE
jgi:hypothetical protein